ncbi:MAG: HAMP domain-containing histidine kinase [Deltaproteobacteria bacterium]|nr:HAMP domain-containing histidine kinase [Deltaproteobacteria bacterium]MCB9785299.1 HAMP domain-containing histidine kinase [Deltaproteobacteria bacterium]
MTFDAHRPPTDRLQAVDAATPRPAASGAARTAADERIAELSARVAELEAFASAVRHDLRTPLTAIQGFADLLLSGFGRLLGRRGSEYIERILEGAQRIEDLIAASKRLADASRLPLNPRAVDLAALARDALTRLTRAEPQRLVSVEISPRIMVFGDPALLTLLMEELLANAWRATAHRRPGRITLRAVDGDDGDDGDDGPAVELTDDGRGLDPSDAPRLLEPFQRGPDHDGQFTPGVGLAVARRIVGRHGGSLRIDGAPDRGATVTFTLSA